MTLTEEQRTNLKKYCVSGYLMSNIHKKNYALLQKLYESCTTDNKKLLQRFNEGRNVGLLPYDQIFVDIHYVIVEEISNNPTILDIFLEHNQKLFPDVYNRALTSLENGKKGHNVLFQLDESTKKNERQWFYKYLLYSLDIIDYISPDDMAEAFVSADLRNYDHQYTASEKEILHASLEEYCFSETEEPVFGSSLFKKAVAKRRNELSDYFGIPEKKLNTYIHDTMKEFMILPKNATENIEINKKSGITGMFQFLLQEIISSHNGGIDWMSLMTNDIGNLYVDQKYVPDVSSLIEDYYRAVTIAKYNEYSESGNPFTKLTLSRECKADTIKEDIANIYAAYEIDVVTKLLMLLAEKHYANFSFEKLSKKRLQERYDSIISECTKRIGEKDSIIEQLTMETEVLKLGLSKDTNNAILEISRVNDRLRKELLDKENELSEYKDKIKTYEEFIQQLQIPVPETLEETLDMSFLQTKRFLIVGSLNEMYPQFREAFPDSVYMQSETTNIASINVDAIIMVIPRMGHSMFYKVKSSTIYGTVPVVMSNNNKFTSICMDIQRILRNSI